MKVLQVMAGYSRGGAETFFLDSIKAVNETPIEQRVITRFNHPYKIDEIKALNIPVVNAKFNRYIKPPTRAIIQRQMDEFQPDIVHHYMRRAGEFSLKNNAVNIGWYGGYYNAKRFKNCTHHVGVTKDVADHIVRQGVPASNVHVLHIYAEFKQAKPLNRSDFNTPDDVPLLLSLSRLHDYKAIDVLLEALVKVPEAYLWIAGSGPVEHKLKKLTKNLNLEERVRFLGWREDRNALLATCDIVTFPSRYESFGAVVIEAWAMEKPLVTAKAMGPKAYVQHEENGLIVEIDDVDALADNINRVINDKKLSNHIVANGKKIYDENFTKDVFKNNITSLYESVL